MTYATTFSGIGGWELGLNACGWELKWQCEKEPFCRTLLNERFGVPIYDDIRTICEQNPPPVDALIGSPPCQPFSVAGAQGGTSDERHLYPSFIKLVAQIQPRWVLMEQVPNILAIDGGRAFGGYIGGLAALSYDVLYHPIPACAVGAPHERNRIYIMAVANEERCRRRRQCDGSSQGADDANQGIWESYSEKTSGLRETIPNSNGSGCEELDAPVLAARTGQYPGNAFKKWSFWNPESCVQRVADGVANRAHRIAAIGNAVVPQIPYLIGQAINEIEST